MIGKCLAFRNGPVTKMVCLVPPLAVTAAQERFQSVLEELASAAAGAQEEVAQSEPNSDTDTPRRPLQERLATAADVLNVNSYMWRTDALSSLDFRLSTTIGKHAVAQTNKVVRCGISGLAEAGQNGNIWARFKRNVLLIPTSGIHLRSFLV